MAGGTGTNVDGTDMFEKKEIEYDNGTFFIRTSSEKGAGVWHTRKPIRDLDDLKPFDRFLNVIHSYRRLGYPDDYEGAALPDSDLAGETTYLLGDPTPGESKFLGPFIRLLASGMPIFHGSLELYYKAPIDEFAEKDVHLGWNSRRQTLMWVPLKFFKSSKTSLDDVLIDDFETFFRLVGGDYMRQPYNV